MRLICLFFVGMFLALSGESQSFDYSFSKDSVAWQELNSQTILNSSNSAWNFSYRIPIGFTFNYLGRNFDSLTIETNGYLVFDENRNYALTAFLGFGDCVDTLGNHSVLGYEVSGTAGNKILKIQFKNTSTSKQSSKYITYQLWLKESGIVEVRVGTNGYQSAMIINGTDTTLTNRDSLNFYRIGLLNMNMDTETNGFFIGGTISSPESQPVDENHPDPIYLMRAPSQGTRYTFTPNSN